MKLLSIILALALEIVPGGKAFLKPLQQRDSILIADQLEYGFELEDVREGTGLALQDFGQITNDTLVLVRGWQVDTLKASRIKGGKARRFNIHASVVLAPFEEGHYTLPRLAVQRMADGRVDTLVFDPVEMDVTTIPVDTATFEIHDIKGQIRYPLTFKEVLPWAAGALLLAALVTFLVIYIRKRRAAVSEAGKPKDPAYIVALRELDKYRGDKYWAPEKQKAFYSGITDALKLYIEDRFGVDAPEMTTAELFDALKADKDITPALFNEVKELFECADFVKFAKHTASEEDNAKALPVAVRFVTSTYQLAVEQESAADGGEAGKD